ncbi:MAG: DnaJ domain-containing protein [Deltaproteobacteria bacterium]|nr:DnaJ domain-containing protein [Deltaproteobacteria bacterium]
MNKPLRPSASDGEDYFRLFGLPRSYAIDRASLDSAYEELSLSCHPDFFAAAPAPELAAARAKSTLVNEAYRVLSSDSLRAEYLLGLLAAGRSLDTRALPEGFLMEMLELQEELDELFPPESPPATDGPQAGQAQRMRGLVKERLESLLEERRKLFAGAGESPDEQILRGLQTNLNCEKYLNRLLERLEIIEQ